AVGYWLLAVGYWLLALNPVSQETRARSREPSEPNDYRARRNNSVLIAEPRASGPAVRNLAGMFARRVAHVLRRCAAWVSSLSLCCSPPPGISRHQRNAIDSGGRPLIVSTTSGGVLPDIGPPLHPSM